jgi:hypothetical protein
MKLPRNSNIVVCGIARDVEGDLSFEVRRLLRSLKEFKSIAFVVVESFSQDKTRDVLVQLQKDIASFKFESISHSSNLTCTRSERLAEARNASLQIQKSAFPDADYVYMTDLDGVNRDLSLRAVMSCWNYPEWDVMTSNQPLGYYDILALRHDYWCQDNWGEAFEELIKYFPKETAAYIALKSKSISISRENPLIPVKSAFGGGAIYTFESINNKSYNGLDKQGKEVCEHVPLNLSIHDSGGKLYINPALVNVRSLGRSHSLKKRLKRRLSHFRGQVG